MKAQAVVNSATNIAEEALQSSQVSLARVMHVKADLLDSISDIGPGEGGVLQGTRKAPIGCRVSNRITHIRRELGLSVNWGGARLTVSHARPLQNIESILSLV